MTRTRKPPPPSLDVSLEVLLAILRHQGDVRGQLALYEVLARSANAFGNYELAAWCLDHADRLEKSDA